jgi:tetratricopeptide (TPR) repeat protein
MPTEFSIPDKSDPPNERLVPPLSETVTPSMSDTDPPTEAGPPRKLWDWLAFFALATLVYHFLALWYRWLRPDPEFLDFSTGVTELLAIASFLGLQTERGQQLVLRLDDTLALKRILGTPRRTCAIAWLAAVLLAVFLYAGSPQAAQLFRRQGVTALEEGNYSAAIQDFEQALSLAAGDARTHYDLASAYEALHNYEQAITEYQMSLELDAGFWPAYNNLGRLYLRARGDPDAALATLVAGQRRADSPLGQAVIGKNVAQAYLEKGLPRASLVTLEGVTENLKVLRDEGMSVEIYVAETHQLRAQVYEVLEKSSEARREWQDSLGYALAVAESERCAAEAFRLAPDCLDAIRWVAEARERLAD